MRAALFKQYGPPTELQIGDRPVPQPGSGELLVRVRAATVNRTDCALMSGKPFVNRLVTGLRRPSHPIPGTDFAGEVVALGEQSRAFAIGDRVFGLQDSGAYSHSEYLCVNEKAAVTGMPANVGFEEAVACLEGAHYAINFLNKVEVKAGDEVLVNGATGAIGSALLQLLTIKGAKITAVCPGEQFPLVKSLGAHELIDYAVADFTQMPGKYHFIFDAVGKSTFGACKPLLLPGGVYISSELGPYSQNLLLALITPLSALFPGDKKRVIFPLPTGRRQNVLFMKNLIEAGHFQPVIDNIYPFSAIREAYVRAGSGQKIGQVVVLMGTD